MEGSSDACDDDLHKQTARGIPDTIWSQEQHVREATCSLALATAVATIGSCIIADPRVLKFVPLNRVGLRLVVLFQVEKNAAASCIVINIHVLLIGGRDPDDVGIVLEAVCGGVSYGAASQSFIHCGAVRTHHIATKSWW